jgi:hypothetical protein
MLFGTTDPVMTRKFGNTNLQFRPNLHHLLILVFITGSEGRKKEACTVTLNIKQPLPEIFANSIQKNVFSVL